MNKTILFSFLKFSHDDFVFDRESVKVSYAHIWKKEKFFYVYLVITNKDMEKYYIGYHCGQLDDLDTGKYKTSSKDPDFKNIMRDPKSHKVFFIIGMANSKIEGLFKELQFLRLYNVKNNKFFWNRCVYSGYVDQTGLKRSTETIEKLRWRRKLYNQTDLAARHRKEQSERMIEHFNLNSEEGQSRRRYNSIKSKEQFDINTERGIKNREHMSIVGIKRFNKNTEEGLKNRENYRQSTLKQFDKNTEEGLKNVLHQRNKAYEQYERVRIDRIEGCAKFTNDDRLKNILISFNIRDERMIKKYFIKNIGGVDYFILNLYSFFSRFTAVKAANKAKRTFNIKMENRSISKEKLKNEIFDILKDISPNCDFDERDIDVFII